MLIQLWVGMGNAASQDDHPLLDYIDEEQIELIRTVYVRAFMICSIHKEVRG